MAAIRRWSPRTCPRWRARAISAMSAIRATRCVGVARSALARPRGATARLADARAFDPFGRDFPTKPALEPPFYAIRVTGALFHTQGGLVIDPRARVLRRDGAPLPNLFAAGGAACGISGP